MTQTRIEILAEVIFPKGKYPKQNKTYIENFDQYSSVGIISYNCFLEAMRRFGEQAYNAGQENILYDFVDIKKEYNDWLTKIEEANK